MTNLIYLFISLPGDVGLLFIQLIAMLIVYCLYLNTLDKTFQTISVENRLMPSRNVWMLLIPIFNFYWHFVVVGKLADSIKAEAQTRNLELKEERPSFNIGVGMCIFNCLSAIPNMGPYIGMVGLFCWVFYWMRIAAFKNLLQQPATY